MDAYTIRPLATTDEYRECVALQEATWGEGFSERVSPAILKVAQMLGGVSAGAYDADGRMVGFVFGLTGLRDGEIVHWSDMLAVRPEARDAGLGRRLKSYQRDQLLARGVETMYWTFDPLQSRNAYLNLSRLGAVVREYREDMYGDTDSPLHQGIGTDRFVALWILSSERVIRRMATIGESASARERRPDAEGGVPKEAPLALSAEMGTRHARPGRPDLVLDADEVRVAIPSDIGAVMASEPEIALRWRAATRAVFGHYLETGYEVREFQRGQETSTYLLARVATPPESEHEGRP